MSGDNPMRLADRVTPPRGPEADDASYLGCVTTRVPRTRINRCSKSRTSTCVEASRKRRVGMSAELHTLPVRAHTPATEQLAGQG